MSSGDRKHECSLCLDNFKDPRILTCFHTYCRECLDNYVAKSKRAEPLFTKFDCPICRACITLPSNGVDGIQKNFYIDQEQPNHPICSVHKTEDLRFYCRECRERICRDCKVVSHEGHATGMAKEIATEMRKELNETFTDTERAINENEMRQRAVVETELGSLETTLSMVEISTGMIKKDVDRLFVFIKNLLTPCIESKKQQACTFEKAYAEKLDQLNVYKVMLTEADSKDGRDIYQIHNDFKNREKNILKLKETPLSAESQDSDEGGIDNSKIVNMLDRLRDKILQATTLFKQTDFSCSGNNKSVSAKRLPSREEEDSASIPFKKLKESDVRDTNQKEFHGNKGLKTTVPPSSSDSQPNNTSKDVPSLFANLRRTSVPGKPTHEVKPVINQSTDGLKTVAANISTCVSQSTDSLSKASETSTSRSIFSVLTGKSQGHSVGIKASKLVNDGKDIETIHMKENKRSSSTHSLSAAAAPNTNYSEELEKKPVAANTFDNGCKTIDQSKVKLKSGCTFQEGETYLVKDKTGQERKMIYMAGRFVDVPNIVPTSTPSGSKVIEGARVELKSGGEFEKGQIYLVLSKSTGEKKTMICTGKQLVELKEREGSDLHMSGFSDSNSDSFDESKRT